MYLSGALAGVLIESDSRRVRARTATQLAGIEVDSAMTLAPAGACSRWSTGWQRPQVDERPDGVGVVLRGSVPPGCALRQALQPVDRWQLVDTSVRTLLLKLSS